MADGSTLWILENFDERFEAWCELETPSDDVRYAVANWLISRLEDPYEGVHRESGFEDLWWGSIPGTLENGLQVCCSYWIYESRHTVRCDSFGSLGPVFKTW